MNELNESVIAEFRANRGVVTEAMGGHFKDTTVTLVHHTGRRTGKGYVQPLLCMTHDDAYVLLGSNGGADVHPSWVANLEAMSETVMELGERSIKVTPTVLRTGDARDQLYAAYVAFWPDVVEYQQNTGRVFPLVRLDPVA